ncbi:MAG: UTP--glucose-1-phosphate uridylyltransferase [Gammaproteobacteria bacterium]|nr:UTP--glucose-1-phosphate uridylyltransferase [Gammaproteobacteria bacterium]
MMPIVDKPLIQYAVEEAVAAGLTDMVFITGRQKRAIEDHFDKAYEIESELASRGRKDLLQLVRDIVPRHVNCIYIRQPEQLGLGQAVQCARPVLGGEPFAVILADDLMTRRLVMRQMVEVYEAEQASLLGIQEVPPEQTASYGIVVAESFRPGLERVRGIVEKPEPAAAPSNLAVIGRYVLTPAIFDHLARIPPGAGGEIQLTDAIASLLAEERVLAYRFDGVRYDCGSKLGYLQATVALGLRHPEVGEAFAAYLATRSAR